MSELPPELIERMDLALRVNARFGEEFARVNPGTSNNPNVVVAAALSCAILTAVVLNGIQKEQA